MIPLHHRHYLHVSSALLVIMQTILDSTFASNAVQEHMQPSKIAWLANCAALEIILIQRAHWNVNGVPVVVILLVGLTNALPACLGNMVRLKDQQKPVNVDCVHKVDFPLPPQQIQARYANLARSTTSS